MRHQIRITSIRREPINTSLLAQALIELVLHQQEQAQQKATPRPVRQQKKEKRS